MQTRALAVIEKLKTPTGLSGDSLQRAIYLLSRNDRFIHQKRRVLKASDLASLLNAIMMGVATALEGDDALSRARYRGSLPAGRAPVFPHTNWRQLLEFMIEHAPASSETPSPLEPGSGLSYTLPNIIEVATTGPVVALIWLGRDGRPDQIDFFGPEGATTDTVGITRKALIDGKIIVTLAEILRTPVVNKHAKSMQTAVQNYADASPKAPALKNRSAATAAPSRSLPAGRVTGTCRSTQDPAAGTSGIFPRSNTKSDRFYPRS